MKNSLNSDTKDKSLSSVNSALSAERSNVSFEIDVEEKLKSFSGTNTIQQIKKELSKNWDTSSVAFLNGGDVESVWLGILFFNKMYLHIIISRKS